MDTNEKLEIFRKLYCLGLSDIEEVFEGTGLEEHLANKYIASRDKHGFYGNFAFLFELDNDNAKLLLKRIGL
jgi:hypothetical protein